MAYQSELELENQLIDKMTKKLGYDFVKILTEEELEQNFRKEFNKLNIDNLGRELLTDKEIEEDKKLLEDWKEMKKGLLQQMLI